MRHDTVDHCLDRLCAIRNQLDSNPPESLLHIGSSKDRRSLGGQLLEELEDLREQVEALVDDESAFRTIEDSILDIQMDIEEKMNALDIQRTGDKGKGPARFESYEEDADLARELFLSLNGDRDLDTEISRQQQEEQDASYAAALALMWEAEDEEATEQGTGSGSRTAHRPRPRLSRAEEELRDLLDDHPFAEGIGDSDVPTTRSGRTYTGDPEAETVHKRERRKSPAVTPEIGADDRKDRLDYIVKRTNSFVKEIQQSVVEMSSVAANSSEVDDGDHTSDFTGSLNGHSLRHHQMLGCRWLLYLHRKGLNGILADEMGLGKTVQVIALLSHLKRQGKLVSLVVAPLSVLSHWTSDVEKFAPHLSVHVHRGELEQRRSSLVDVSRSGFRDVDIVVTTYELVLRDSAVLSSISWDYLVVDEAHRLKNKSSRLFRELSQFSCEHRLLLTGTPLQNNLGELWALLNFILPSIFSSSSSFEQWFSAPFVGKNKRRANVSLSPEEELSIISCLHSVLRPFLLRRMKDDVEPLPTCEERVVQCPLSELQRFLLRLYCGSQKDRDTSMDITNLVMMMRKICNHPWQCSEALFAEKDVCTDRLVQSSGKLLVLRIMIRGLLGAGHRILIFSQFTSSLDFIADLLDLMSIRFHRLDGNTPMEEREQGISDFNAGECDVFILSTRAGGLGLNLQSADTVILFDSDWNPQADLQAMARVHRIGQTEKVMVLRMMCPGTVEEVILQRAGDKRLMEEKIVEAGRFNYTTTASERRRLLHGLISSGGTTATSDGSLEATADIDMDALITILCRSDVDKGRLQSALQDVDTEARTSSEVGMPPAWMDCKRAVGDVTYSKALVAALRCRSTRDAVERLENIDKEEMARCVIQSSEERVTRTRGKGDTKGLRVRTRSPSNTRDAPRPAKRVKPSSEEQAPKRNRGDASDEPAGFFECELCGHHASDWEEHQLHVFCDCPNRDVSGTD